MGKFVFIIFVLVLFFSLLFLKEVFFEGEKIVSFFNEGIKVAEIEAEVADSSGERRRGLSGRKELASMIFVFPDEKERSFWMKDMNFALDIVFLDKNYNIVKIIKSAEPCSDDCSSLMSEQPSQFVIELEQGFTDNFNITERTRVLVQ